MVTRRPIQGAPEAARLSERTCEETVAASQGLLLVDSWADWCGPGHTIAPVLGDLAAASEDRVTPGKVNVVTATEIVVDGGATGAPYGAPIYTAVTAQ